MSKAVLLVTEMAGASNFAAVLGKELALEVDVASRREVLATLRGQSFAVVVVEESMVGSDEAWGDLLWQQAGCAVPLQVNFAICGSARLVREVRAALVRRDHEGKLARREAAKEVEDDLRSSVTGLLLRTELTLRDRSVPASLAPKLRELVELAGLLRDRLRPAA